MIAMAHGNDPSRDRGRRECDGPGRGDEGTF
jgi:hypothetical protein